MANSIQVVLERMKTAVGVVGVAHAEGIAKNLADAGWQVSSCAI